MKEFFESFFPKENIFNDTIKVHASYGGAQHINPMDLSINREVKETIEKIINGVISVYKEHQREVDNENKREQTLKNKNNWFHFDCHWGY
ncbi:MAG: hypothetical protein UT05_C0011G0025 [Parcubacteria group bacterium GW2011_GWF2_38_76]|nr:MAG: hypothetical protein UT05_C0011G0025 [Parcubacteria group bacterium GW2011_GWF2_38_76]HBM45381.1 hypothetical protein [Patescibacteria group bacterium]